MASSCSSRTGEPHWRYMLRAYRCGLHSGLRRCCIRWWLREWVDLDEAQRAAYRGSVRFRHEYVPCPGCLGAGRPPVPVYQCYVEDSSARWCRAYDPPVLKVSKWVPMTPANLSPGVPARVATA